MKKIKIRAHHLLCMQGYQGYGYNKEFTENMDLITSKIKQNTSEIKLCSHADDICAKCPNLKDNKCIDDNNNLNIISMDKYVLNRLKYPKKYLNPEKTFEKLNNILTKEDIKDICGDCSWIEKCLYYQKLDKQ